MIIIEPNSVSNLGTRVAPHRAFSLVLIGNLILFRTWELAWLPPAKSPDARA